MSLSFIFPGILSEVFFFMFIPPLSPSFVDFGEDSYTFPSSEDDSRPFLSSFFFHFLNFFILFLPDFVVSSHSCRSLSQPIPGP